jgi:anti-sigma regulatory factor (Ser/Thr protein kinase)
VNGEHSAGPAPYEVYTQILAHELRTPVTAISGYLQLLEDERMRADPELLREFLAVVRGRASDLARIVAELTTFNGLLGRHSPAATGTSGTLPDIVAELAGGRPVRAEIAAGAAPAAVDGERLALVLRVLLDNAAKYGLPGAEVRVRASLDGEPPRLVVRVTNEGPPIPEGRRTAIFEPFRQAEDHQTRRHGGLGLGLAVARRAAEGVGGTLALEPGAPTTFRLELPLRADPIARQARELRERLALADGQALRAIQDFRAARREATALAGQLDRAYLETVAALARAVEARDGSTGDHVERVRRSSMRLADALQLAGEGRRHLEFAAVLHDVGKLGLPDTVLGKPGPLSSEEWASMRQHPEIGRQVLEGVAFLAPVLDIVATHHERWDGQGYPGRLAGAAIPLAARIIAVADAYDAMTTDRPYRPALPEATARAELERGRGGQFDPQIVDAFLGHTPINEPGEVDSTGNIGPGRVR